MPKHFNATDFYECQDPAIQPLLYAIREVLIYADPHLVECIKYNTAFYTRKSWVCYIGKIRLKTGVEVGFPRGYEISNEHGLLETKDRKAMKGIMFSDLDDFYRKEPVFLEIIQEALLLDDIREKSAAADLLNGRAKRIQPK